MSEIVRHDYGGSVIRQRNDGYVCLTDMAQASDKKVNDYFRLKSTKEYLDGFSAVTGIPVTALTQGLQGGDDQKSQGTWAHPEIAIDFAKWCSIPFRIWANRTLRVLMEKKKIQAEPAPSQLAPAEKVDLALTVAERVLKNVRLGKTSEQSESLKAGVLVSVAQAAYPELAPVFAPVQSTLAATNTISKEDVVWLTPTTLGKRLGISAIKVNRALRDMGLQTKVDKPAKGEPSWLPTERGDDYASMTAATGGNGDTTTYQHLKWSERVLELFTVDVEVTAA